MSRPAQALTPMDALDDALYRGAVEIAVNAALDQHVAMVALGVDAAGRVWLCGDGCCTSGDGVTVVVPDVIAIQMALAGRNDCDGAWRVQASDGRTAYLFGAVRDAETLNALDLKGEAP